MIIPSQKDLFTIPQDICYLNAAYMTPQTRAMTKAGADGIMSRAQPWGVVERDFFTEPENVRALFAKIIAAKNDDIALIPSTSYGIAIAAKNIKLKTGQSILVLEEQFPSNIYAWLRMASEQGLNIEVVKNPKDGNWTQAVLKILQEKGEQIGIAALPACHWADGGLLDLKKIEKQVKKLSAFLVLDITQSLGAMPFSVQDVDADYVISSGYKWLFCPYTISFIYVAPRHQDHGVPLEENWANRKNSDNFAKLVQYEARYQAGARRYDMGERAHFALMPQAKQSLSQILDWGVGNIAETIAEFNLKVENVFNGFGFEALYKPTQRAHILGLKPTKTLPEGFSKKLYENGVRLSVRGENLRIAPHVYNDDQDLILLEKALKNTFAQ